MTCHAAHHQEAIEVFWLPSQGSLMLHSLMGSHCFRAALGFILTTWCVIFSTLFPLTAFDALYFEHCTNQHKKLEIKLSDTFLPAAGLLDTEKTALIYFVPLANTWPQYSNVLIWLWHYDTGFPYQSEVHSDLAGFAFSESCLSGAWLSPSSSLPVKEAICKTYPRWGRACQAPD